MHPTDEKRLLRDGIVERIKRMTDSQRAAESRSLCRRLLPAIPKGSVVAGFMPFVTEPDLRMLLKELLARGDRIVLPRFEKGLIFREATDLKELTPGELNTLEPPADAPILDPETLSVALVPARGYTLKGQRLGRGNGGYDRWIRLQRKLNPRTKFIGVCFDCQVVPDVPMEEHDEMVDAIATARGITECH